VRALVVTEIGRPPRLAERADPAPDEGEACIRVHAVPLNPVDASVAAGRFFAGHPPVPYVPGLELVGEVVASAAHPAGTQVFACLRGLGVARDGGCAELAVAADDQLIALPPQTDPVTAGLAGTAALAGWIPLTWRAPVRPDDTVVVLGATGSVGAVAVQAARLLGAHRIVAVGRDRARLEATVELGADAWVALDDARGLGPALAEACPDGASLVFDPLWGDPLVAALGVAVRGARVLQLGQSASPEATIPSGLIRGKDIDMFGYTNLTVPFDVLRAAYLDLVGHIAAGRIRLRSEVSPLTEAEAAWRRLEEGPGCKVIVRLDGGE
jgi:NADPH:quinone reductase-like Zn-dependent oxidoreductase